jgi:transposase
MAVSSSGQVEHMMQDGGVKRYQFADFITRLPFPPGTVIILDNCSIHKKMEHVFEAKQYKPLFLPPYSPQLQPIELAFSVVKNHFRQLWPWKAGVVDAVVESINALQPSHISNFFKHTDHMLHSWCTEGVAK